MCWIISLAFHTQCNREEQRTYWKWKWEGDELVSEYGLTYKGDALGRPYFVIDLQLGTKMGWFRYNEYGQYAGQYELGPNLKQELFDPNIIPEINGHPSGNVLEPVGSGHQNAGRYVFGLLTTPFGGSMEATVTETMLGYRIIATGGS